MFKTPYRCKGFNTICYCMFCLTPIYSKVKVGMLVVVSHQDWSLLKVPVVESFHADLVVMLLFRLSLKSFCRFFVKHIPCPMNNLWIWCWVWVSYYEISINICSLSLLSQCTFHQIYIYLPQPQKYNYSSSTQRCIFGLLEYNFTLERSFPYMQKIHYIIHDFMPF